MISLKPSAFREMVHFLTWDRFSTFWADASPPASPQWGGGRLFWRIGPKSRKSIPSREVSLKAEGFNDIIWRILSFNHLEMGTLFIFISSSFFNLGGHLMTPFC